MVSLHLTGGNAPKNGAMGSVITPSYRTFSRPYSIFTATKLKKKIRAQFKASAWKNWFLSAASYGRFEMFLLDSWVYFTGSWSTPSGLEPYRGKFRGLRHNMVSWSYQQTDVLHQNVSISSQKARSGIENRDKPKFGDAKMVPKAMAETISILLNNYYGTAEKPDHQ